MSFQRLRPLVSFDSENRANFISQSSLDSSLMSSKKSRSRSRKGASKHRKSTSRPGQKIRLVKGRVSVKLAGNKKAVRIAPAKLIGFISKSNIRQAAQKLYNNPTKRRRRATRKTRK